VFVLSVDVQASPHSSLHRSGFISPEKIIMLTEVLASEHLASAETHARFGPKLISTLPGRKAAAIIQDDQSLLSPSYTRDYPLVVKNGRGCRIEDVDGNQFLDFTAGIAVTSTDTATRKLSKRSRTRPPI